MSSDAAAIGDRVVQVGGEYADNIMVKITSQVLNGVTKPPSNSFEKLLVEYDKMNTIKAARKLTPKEEHIYNKVQRTIDKRFDEMFNKADPLMKELETHKKKGTKIQYEGVGGGVNAATSTDQGTQTVNNSGTQTNETSADVDSMFHTRNRMFLWFKECLYGIWKFFKGLFGNALNKKLEEALSFFSVTNLASMVNNDPKKIAKLGDDIKKPLEDLQKNTIKGISGAATASVEMVMNAFSMIPGLGTTILVWRMFQNLLVIMGATLSTQAGANTVQNAAANVIGPDKLVKAHEEAVAGGTDETGGGGPSSVSSGADGKDGAGGEGKTPDKKTDGTGGPSSVSSGAGGTPGKQIGTGGGTRKDKHRKSITKKIKLHTAQLNRSMQTYMRLFSTKNKQIGGSGNNETYNLPIRAVSGYKVGKM